MTKPFVNLDDVEFTDIEDNGYYTSRRAQFSAGIGARKLGYNIRRRFGRCSAPRLTLHTTIEKVLSLHEKTVPDVQVSLKLQEIRFRLLRGDPAARSRPNTRRRISVRDNRHILRTAARADREWELVQNQALWTAVLTFACLLASGLFILPSSRSRLALGRRTPATRHGVN